MNPDPGARKPRSLADAHACRRRLLPAGGGRLRLQDVSQDDYWRRLARAFVLGTVLTAATAAAASAGDSAATTAAMVPLPHYSAMVVFGDSLSDNGNAGRYSNGPPWVQLLAERLDMPLQPSRSGGSNYAFGGALTHGRPDDVRGQVARYLASQGGRADPQALYVVYAGSNDLLSVGCMAGRDGAARTAAAALGASVADLASAGARTILVPNLPDLGYAPMVRIQGAACTAEARRLTRVFNAALDGRLDQIDARTHIRTRRLDVHGLTDRLMADPEAAGFHDVTTPCLQDRCDGLLFWDHLHPTEAAHAVLAAAALEILRPEDGRE